MNCKKCGMRTDIRGMDACFCGDSFDREISPPDAEFRAKYEKPVLGQSIEVGEIPMWPIKLGSEYVTGVDWAAHAKEAHENPRVFAQQVLGEPWDPNKGSQIKPGTQVALKDQTNPERYPIEHGTVYEVVRVSGGKAFVREAWWTPDYKSVCVVSADLRVVAWGSNPPNPPGVISARAKAGLITPSDIEDKKGNAITRAARKMAVEHEERLKSEDRFAQEWPATRDWIEDQTQYALCTGFSKHGRDASSRDRALQIQALLTLLWVRDKNRGVELRRKDRGWQFLLCSYDLPAGNHYLQKKISDLELSSYKDPRIVEEIVGKMMAEWQRVHGR